LGPLYRNGLRLALLHGLGELLVTIVTNCRQHASKASHFTASQVPTDPRVPQFAWMPHNMLKKAGRCSAMSGPRLSRFRLWRCGGRSAWRSQSQSYRTL